MQGQSRGSNKAKRERTVPIDEETANHYRVCCDGEYTTGTISKQFHAILKDLGYDRTPDGGTRNFHCLRHTFAVRQYAKTGDIYLVSKLLGHSSVKTTERYARFDLQMLYQDFPECDIMRG